jgi:hypothetical protein
LLKKLTKGSSSIPNGIELNIDNQDNIDEILKKGKTNGKTTAKKWPFLGHINKNTLFKNMKINLLIVVKVQGGLVRNRT